MANETNYGWAYVHPTASQAQARGVDKSIQFLSGAVDSNGIGVGSGSAKLTFDYTLATPQLELTGNMTASGHISASAFYGDGTNLQGVSSFPYDGDAVITGSLTVTNAITASNYVIENTFEINNAGSSVFGNTNDDTHVFTGSVSFVSGTTVDVNYTPSSNQLKVPGLRVSYRTESSTAFSASASDYIIGIGSSVSTAVLVELPDASTAGSGSLIVIKDEATGGARSSGNAITVSASSGDTVDDVHHVTIAGTMASKTFYSNGDTKWFVI
tara:strand:+ start:6384 stop:7193 length:810 start_codon:yes stop_codon:yes gene_type:complete